MVALSNALRMELRFGPAPPSGLCATFVDKPDAPGEADAPGRAIWDRNRGLWRQVGLDAVVASALSAIERRRRMVVVRRSITPVMWMPGVLHRCSNAPVTRSSRRW